LSKIESGNLTIHNDSIDVYRLCREIYHIFKLKANEKYLKFLHFISSDVPPYLIIDEVRIRQVLLNLISNAIKFTETGYILLIIDAEKNVQNPENYNLIFRIIDTGIGIPPEQQTIIFDAFRQMDGKSNRRFGGTGLGLTISKKLTELMNGNISLKSNPNDGSEFLIYLNNLKSSDIKDSTEFWINEIYSVTFNKCTLLAFVSQDTKNILDITFRGNDSSIIYVDSFTSLKLALESIHYDVVIVEDINSNQLSSEFITEIQNINFDNLKLILISSDKRIAENTNILLNIESWISAPAKREQLLFELSKYIKFETKSNSLKYKEQILNDSSISDSSLEIVKCVIDNELSNFKDKFKIDIPIDEATHFGMLLINRGSSINNRELIEVGKKIIKTASNYDFEQLYKIIKTLFS
jgi:two-component system sensor histidine kinase EvgS